MKRTTKTIMINEKQTKVDLMEYDETDIHDWYEVLNAWLKLTEHTKRLGYRGVNIPEALSEVALSIVLKCPRLINIHGNNISNSPDLIDVDSNVTIQVKATSVENDCTSFGTSNHWDRLVFMDFYNGGNVNGSFDIYEIPKEKLLSYVVNAKKAETFQDHQDMSRRPRLNLKKNVLKEMNIMPVDEHIILGA